MIFLYQTRNLCQIRQCLRLVQYFSISVVHLCFVCVCVWLFPYGGSLVGTVNGAENAHLLGTPAHDMVETAQQPAGWWILATGVEFTGFSGQACITYSISRKLTRKWSDERHIMNEVNSYTPHLGSFIQYQKKSINHQIEKKLIHYQYSIHSVYLFSEY